MDRCDARLIGLGRIRQVLSLEGCVAVELELVRNLGQDHWQGLHQKRVRSPGTPGQGEVRQVAAILVIMTRLTRVRERILPSIQTGRQNYPRAQAAALRLT